MIKEMMDKDNNTVGVSCQRVNLPALIQRTTLQTPTPKKSPQNNNNKILRKHVYYH